MLAQKEMPAITSVAAMLDKYSNDDTSSIPKLSKAILHDQGLSSCLLKVANNASRYSSSKINTVSRAAIVIGIHAVKNICITSKILEGLLDSKNLAPQVHHRISILMANAFYAGLLAKMMVPTHSDDTQEEVYLAAMLYHIGETSFWSMPSNDANCLIKDVHIDPKQFQIKCKQQLGFSFSGLSIGLAKTWKLGEILIKSLDHPESRTNEMQLISLANQLSEAISCPSESKLQLDSILKRISIIMKIDVDQLKVKIESTRELALKLLASYGATVLEKHIKPLPDKFPKNNINPVVVEESKEKILLRLLKHLTGMCASHKNINDLLTFTLQQTTLTLGFDRCAFWRLTADRKQIQARSAFDRLGHVETLKRSISVSDNANLASHVIDIDNPILVNNCNDEKWRHYVTPELSKLIGCGAICLVPIKIDNKVVGIVSGQLFDKTEKISDDDFSQFNFLFEHLNMCLSIASHH